MMMGDTSDWTSPYLGGGGWTSPYFDGPQVLELDPTLTVVYKWLD